VIPDINLPDNQQYIESGEKEMDYPMEWTEINPVPHSQDITDLKGLETLRKNSEARIKASPQFSKVIANAMRIKQFQDETMVPLQLDQYRAIDMKRETESNEFKKAFGKINGLTPANLAMDLPVIQSDSSRIGRNQAWFDSMEKDIYIEETLHIMKDLVAMTHKS